jgi:hypothetical protein
VEPLGDDADNTLNDKVKDLVERRSAKPQTRLNCTSTDLLEDASFVGSKRGVFIWIRTTWDTRSVP